MFDPIHHGHLRPALEILESLNLQQIRFVPCAHPPHRTAPVADAAFRAKLVAAAIAGQPGFVLDERELRRPGPSYTVDTLESLRQEFPAVSLCLLLGMDAFLGLPRWHRWEAILELAHLIVMHRPGSSLAMNDELVALFKARRISDPARLTEQRAGCIFTQAVTQLEISSTTIREQVAAGMSARYLMPEPAWELIRTSGLYQQQAEVKCSQSN